MNMIQETFENYILTAAPLQTSNGRWSVSVIIKQTNGSGQKSRRFYADDGISYILEIEAAKECLNLGRNLIKRNLAGL